MCLQTRIHNYSDGKASLMFGTPRRERVLFACYSIMQRCRALQKGWGESTKMTNEQIYDNDKEVPS